MSSVKALIARHPALTYFALTFAISWGLVVLVVGPGGFPGTTEQTQSLLAYAVLGMVAGPSIAGIVLTAALGGRPARREFRQRLFKWDVGGRWYAAALLIAPAAVPSILLTLSLISRTFVAGIVINDHRTALMMFDVAWFVVIWVVIAAVGWSGLTRKHDREDFVEQRVSGSAIYVSELHWRVFASGGCVVAVAVAIWFARTTLLDLYAIGISHIAPEWQRGRVLRARRDSRNRHAGRAADARLGGRSNRVHASNSHVTERHRHDGCAAATHVRNAPRAGRGGIGEPIPDRSLAGLRLRRHRRHRRHARGNRFPGGSSRLSASDRRARTYARRRSNDADVSVIGELSPAFWASCVAAGPCQCAASRSFAAGPDRGGPFGAVVRRGTAWHPSRASQRGRAHGVRW